MGAARKGTSRQGREGWQLGQRKESKGRTGQNNREWKEVWEDQGLLEQETVKAMGRKDYGGRGGPQVLPFRSNWP